MPQNQILLTDSEENEKKLKELIRKRASVKSKLTNFIKKVNEAYTAESPDIGQLEYRKAAMIEAYKDFETYQSQIEFLVVDMEPQSIQRAEFEDDYYPYLSKVDEIIKRHSPRDAGSHSSLSNYHDPALTAIHRADHDIRVKLPQMQLPEFNSTCEEWAGFADVFRASVHDNPNFKGAQKLLYLRSCLKGQSLEKVQSLETTNENYAVAWEILEKSYNDPILIINKRVKALFELPVCTKSNPQMLSSLLDNATKHYNALVALKKPFLEAFPIYAITSKMDYHTHQKWKEETQGDEELTVDKVLAFLQKRQKILETSNNKVFNEKKIKVHQNKTTAHVVHTKEPYCSLCKLKTHYTYSCEKLNNAEPTTRFELIKNANLCINCFRSDHRASECKSKLSCHKCSKKHHTLLHRENLPQPTVATSATLSAHIPSPVLLSTAVINIYDHKNKPLPCRVLLDGGSQSHFITTEMANKLRLPQQKINVPVSGIEEIQTIINSSVSAKISSRTNQFQATLNFLIMPKITTPLPSLPVQRSLLEIPSNIKLADPNFHQPSKIDALIGVEIFYKLLCIGRISIKNTNACAQKTLLGWIISGNLSKEVPISTNCLLSLTELNKNIERFWEVEEPSKKQMLSFDEKACDEHYRENTTRDPETGKYIVRLPFKKDPSVLGESYSRALRQLRRLEQELSKNPMKKKMYDDFIQEYIDLGHASVLDEDDRSGYYIPHLTVYKESSLTTKLRAVFNASAKTSTGFALNDIMYTGRNLQEDLFSLSVRFRIYVYVLSADIEKMYRQTFVYIEDRIYQKILVELQKRIRTLILNTVTYGETCSAYLAVKSLLQLAEDERKNYPIGAQVLEEDFYVDNALTGARTKKEAIIKRDQLIKITKSGGLNLRQWASNDPTLIKDLPELSQETFLRLDTESAINTLGLHWNTRKDKIVYLVNIENKHKTFTKRSILSQIAKLFDPLGLLGPVIVRAKILMQSLWLLKLDWDETVPQDIQSSWSRYLNELPSLNDYEIPRHVLINNYSQVQLHCFCDASEKAYGACFYIVSKDESGATASHLLCSKSRVAPLKTITIPKLELNAARLLTDLYTAVTLSLRYVRFERIQFWSDSTIVLNWLHTPPHTLKCFVANRVTEILKNAQLELWRHVRTHENPADLISRGMMPSELISNELWRNGPTWLLESDNKWPDLVLDRVEVPELRPIISLPTTTSKNQVLVSYERYQSYKRLKRAIAYALRFMKNVRRKLQKQELVKTELSVEELNEAEVYIIKDIQKHSFFKEIFLINKEEPCTLSPLKPFIDNEGILRVGGRLEFSDLPDSQKRPILLPYNHKVTRLIASLYHTANKHSGTQGTLSALREKFWIVNGKNLIKSVIHKCVLCFKAKPKFPNYIMGNLPKGRVTFKRPFLHAGVDFCGPFLIKEKRFRNRKSQKVYVAIFVCFATKATHIELVQDLTAEAFIACLKRFFARRGKSSDIYSDNGTNFVGAKNEIDELYNFYQSSEIQKEIINNLADQNIRWHFIPPRASHFGGLWESAVKSFKKHIVRSIGNTLLTYDAFLTYIIEIEAILNSRPIIPLSSDPNDLQVLTPGHFLIGDSLNSIPDYDFRDTPSNRLSAWEHVQKMKRHFWERWTKDYLQELTVRKKWHSGKTDDIKVGQIVMIKEDNLHPLQWKMGRITAAIPGQDGLVRVVSLKTADSDYVRSVKKIAPLPIDYE